MSGDAMLGRMWITFILLVATAALVFGCTSNQTPRPGDTSQPSMNKESTNDDASAAGTGHQRTDAGNEINNDLPKSSTEGDVKAEAKNEFTLAVVGDIMLARGIEASIAQHGIDYPLANVAERLKTADYTFANLEAPFGFAGRAIPGKQIWFRAKPSSIEAIVNGGIDGVTIANNHILDYDTENFLETLSLLKENNIDKVGGGRDIEEARAPLVIDVNGVTLAFLAYSEFADIFWDWNYPRSFAAGPELPGVAPIREETLGKDIAEAKKVADLVAVAYHWGDEYVNVPNEEQKRLGRKTIDLGANFVLGFHPHAIQGIEVYQEGLIAYSLGNFVMDQKKPIQRESMILELRLSPEAIIDYEVIPVMIENNQPQIVHGDQAAELLRKMEKISAVLVH